MALSFVQSSDPTKHTYGHHGELDAVQVLDFTPCSWFISWTIDRDIDVATK